MNGMYLFLVVVVFGPKKPSIACPIGDDTGISDPDPDDYCVFGNETCCELTIEECQEEVFSFALHFQNSVLGDELSNNGLTAPLNSILEDSISGIRDEALGTYNAISPCGNAFSFTIVEILKNSADLFAEIVSDSSTDSETLVSVETNEQKSTIFLGLVGNDAYFTGLVLTQLNPDDPSMYFGYLYILDSPPESTDLGQRRLKTSRYSKKPSPYKSTQKTRGVSHPISYQYQSYRRENAACESAFSAAVSAYSCPNPEHVLTVNPVCRAGIVEACETAIETSKEEYEAAVETALEVMKTAKLALQVRRAAQIAAIFARCLLSGWLGALAYAACVAVGIAILEATIFAQRLIIEAAFDAAVEAAKAYRDFLIEQAINVASAGVDACFECDCPEDDECCDDPDPCCDDPDPCCGSTDPCCGSDDPCCGSTDPCCGSSNPCCGSTDPCCGSSNPCCGRTDCDDDDPEVEGDPHFKTWNGTKYSYHGECDLIGMTDSAFDNNTGLEVHFRTTINHQYSFVEAVSVLIGKENFRMNRWGEYKINGVLQENKNSTTEPEFFAGYPFDHWHSPKEYYHRFHIKPSSQSELEFKAFEGMVYIKMHGRETFHGALGMLGDADSGYMVGRDGKTIINDINAFGLEWQVRDTDPQLFSDDIRHPKYPEPCKLKTNFEPILRSSSKEINREQASKHCAHWLVDKENCIFDVMATGNVDLAKIKDVDAIADDAEKKLDVEMIKKN